MIDETQRMDRAWNDARGAHPPTSRNASSNDARSNDARSNDARSNDARSIDARSNDARGRDRRVDEDGTPTAELDLPYGPSTAPYSTPDTGSSDTRTRPYNFGDDAGAGWAAGDRASDAPTQRFGTLSDDSSDAWVDAGGTRAYTRPYEAPVTEPTHAPQTSAGPASVPQTSPRPTPRPQVPPATQPAAMQQPAPIPQPQHPLAPVGPVGAGYGSMPISRPVGPNAFARFGAVLLAAMLVVPGLLLLTYGIVVALADTANTATGFEAIVLPGVGLHLLLIFGGAILLLAAAMTARMSGLGAGIFGTVLLVVGLAALVWPSELGGWLVGQPWFPATGVTGAVADAVTSLTTTVFGALSLSVGAIFVAVASAVHGARQAGWDRGRGV